MVGSWQSCKNSSLLTTPSCDKSIVWNLGVENWLLRWPVKQRLRPLLVCYFRCKSFQEKFLPKKKTVLKKKKVYSGFEAPHEICIIKRRFLILRNTTSMMSISVWRFQMKFHYSGGCWVFEGFPLHWNCMSPSSSRVYSSRKTLQTMTIIAIPIAF